MKLTFIKKSDGKISEKNIAIPSHGRPVQTEKDLFFYIDLDDKRIGSHPKSCKISKIIWSKTDEKVKVVFDLLKGY